jgi:putative intracellular protease/amidase
VEGKQIAVFSDAEEVAAGLNTIVPFPLETKLREQGAKYSKAPLWQEHVVTDERLITGQNPASAFGVGAAIANWSKK